MPAIRNLFWRKKLDAQAEKELRFHLDEQVAQNIAAGLTPAEAERSARLALGAPESIKEEMRAARSGQRLSSILQDAGFGFRMLRRNPGFSILAILCLTLGIGANAAVFSWIEGILFRPYPAVAQQERVLAL